MILPCLKIVVAALLLIASLRATETIKLDECRQLLETNVIYLTLSDVEGLSGLNDFEPIYTFSSPRVLDRACCKVDQGYMLIIVGGYPLLCGPIQSHRNMPVKSKEINLRSIVSLGATKLTLNVRYRKGH